MSNEVKSEWSHEYVSFHTLLNDSSHPLVL